MHINQFMNRSVKHMHLRSDSATLGALGRPCQYFSLATELFDGHGPGYSIRHASGFGEAVAGVVKICKNSKYEHMEISENTTRSFQMISNNEKLY